MKSKDYVAEYQYTERTPEKIRRQFKVICDYLKAEVDNIIPDDLPTVQKIKLKIELNPSEIIRMIRVYENGVDFKEGKENDKNNE